MKNWWHRKVMPDAPLDHCTKHGDIVAVRLICVRDDEIKALGVPDGMVMLPGRLCPLCLAELVQVTQVMSTRSA